MPDVLYDFKTGVVDFLAFNGATTEKNITTGPYDWTFVSRTGTAGSSYVYPTGEPTYANVRNAFLTTYSSDPLLNNDQVKAIGYGWQKWIVPKNAIAEMTVRGACGGHSATTTAVFNQSTGLYTSGIGCRGGRGAKLKGNVSLNKGDILYILVGIRGWCNRVVNYGAHGGGASVVLRDNPAGTYTFAPLNRKVDVLFVAGGGGGSWDEPTVANNATHIGKDAIFTNGANTLGYTQNGSGPRPGAGLTGNSAVINCNFSPPRNQTIYNLLAGIPADATSSRGSCVAPEAGVPTTGTWGSAGGGYNGGGGGSGYSGGSVSDTTGGNGGTSYINPSLVTELFRGYETDPAMNPYSIPGSIQITLPGKDEAEWFLARDAEGNKRWEPSQNKWVLIPNQGSLTALDYETYGTVRSINGVSGLIDGEIEILCSSPYPTKSLTITGLVRVQLVKCNFEMSLVQVDVFKSWNLNNLHPSVTIKVAVSVDHGLTYKILASNIWTTIDINNKDFFYAQGITLQDLNTIPNGKWKELGATNLRFAFIVHQNASYNNPVLSSIELVADLLGSWRKAIHGTNYDYEYISPDTCKITINTAGDYKINYLDQVDE